MAERSGSGRRGSRIRARIRRERRARGLALGLILVLGGTALLLWVGWAQWGTGLATAHAQARLKAEFSQVLAHPGAHRGRVLPGGAQGLLMIPRLDVNVAFVEGITTEALAKGPGHYPETPLPGRGGNVAIAGHRTTHGAPFWAIDTLRRGDDITLVTRAGRFVYRIQWVGVGPPDSRWAVAPTPLPALTLTSCWPRFSASKRLIVRAVQIYGRIPNGFVDHRFESLESWTRPQARWHQRNLAPYD